MNDADNGSDIARLRRRIALEEDAARLGLTGLAIVASHEIITARMERGAERIKLEVTPEARKVNDKLIGRIGAASRERPCSR